MFKQRLLTNAERTRRGIGIDPTCGICGQEYEDVLHTLWDCTAARDIWNHLIPLGEHPTFYSGSLFEWMELNLRNQQAVNLARGVNWHCLFGIIIWCIWKYRNLYIFQGLAWDSNLVIKVSLS